MEKSLVEIKNKLNSILEIYSNIIEKKIIKTIPMIFNKQYDENFISDYLAYILNPNDNGIGILPLQELIYKANNFSLDGILDDEIKVYREFTFNNFKRIDILIEVGDRMVIGLENKIFSSESFQQTKIYEEKIKEEYPERDYLFLFLTLNKAVPSSEEFINITYYDLLEILESIKYDSIKNIKQKVIYEDFLEHLREKIVMNYKNEISEKTKLYIKNEKMIKDLHESAINEGGNLIKNLIFDYFKVKFIDENINNEWVFNFDENRKYQQIFKEKWKKYKYPNFPHFEFHISKENIFTKNKIAFFLEVDNINSKEFQEYKNYYIPYEKSNVLYCPKNNKKAFAYKEYKNYLNINNFNEIECRKMIDEVINDFKPVFLQIDKIIDKYFENKF